MKFAEHQSQVAVVRWAHLVRLPSAPDVEAGSTIASYLLAIPMGGKRDKMGAIRLKAEGAKAGVSDLLLPLSRQGFSSFWLEMKSPDGRLTKEQREWLEKMRLAGHRAECHSSWIDAANAIADYVGVSPPDPARMREEHRAKEKILGRPIPRCAI